MIPVICEACGRDVSDGGRHRELCGERPVGAEPFKCLTCYRLIVDLAEARAKLAEAQSDIHRACRTAYDLTLDCQTAEEACSSLVEMVRRERSAREAERRELVEALQPFADIADQFETRTGEYLGDDRTVHMQSTDHPDGLVVLPNLGAWRRVRGALDRFAKDSAPGPRKMTDGEPYEWQCAECGKTMRGVWGNARLDWCGPCFVAIRGQKDSAPGEGT